MDSGPTYTVGLGLRRDPKALLPFENLVEGGVKFIGSLQARGVNRLRVLPDQP